MTDPRADPLLALARLEGVPAAIRSSRDSVDALLRDRGLRSVTAEERAAARVAGAQASATLQTVIDRGRLPQPETDAVADWLPGALRLHAELTELAGQLRRTPPQVFARAHTLLAHDLVPESSLGRLRSEPEIVERMAGLGRLLSTPSTAPTMVLAAVAHAELATVEPFGAGDALLGRAVEHMLLVDGGVDVPAVIVVEAGHLAAASDYVERLDGYRTGTSRGVRDWLLHCAAAVVSGVERSPVAGQERLAGDSQGMGVGRRPPE